MSFTNIQNRLIPAAAALLVTSLLLSGVTASAEARGRSRFGLGIMFREDADFGVQARWHRLGGDKLALVPQVGYFFDPELFDINLDVHYTVNETEANRVYVFGGGNLATDFDDTEVGINVGGGVSKDLTTSLNGFLELKYVISDFDGLALHAGLHF